MHNHSIRNFPALPSHVYSSLPDNRQINKKEEKEAVHVTDEEILIRLNAIAGKHPFCRYRKVKSHDPL